MPCIDGVTVSDGWIPLVDFMRPSILWNLCILLWKEKMFYMFYHRKEVYYEEEEDIFMKEVYYEEEGIFVYESLFI